MALELQPSHSPGPTPVELTSVFDEVRVLIEAAYAESQIDIEWDLPDRLPLVMGDRYGLIQVFLNLARNSQRAMESSPVKKLRVSATEDGGTVTIRFEDSGTGVESPQRLFQPFQPNAASTGLGLYVSRAIVRSFGGSLAHEPRPAGACFAIALGVVSVEAGVHA
jgi:C4-dicarboxylate-specific signal transduction histidine kinase